MSDKIIRNKYSLFKSEFAAVNNIELHYVKAGPDDGKLIIFLHGFPQFWYMWRDQLLEFSKDYLAVAPDMRGYNLSSKPKGVDQYQLHHILVYNLLRYSDTIALLKQIIYNFYLFFNLLQ